MARLTFAMGLVAAATCCGLSAQDVTLHAKIPFDFRMDKAEMPAGQYNLHYSGGVLRLDGWVGGYKAVFALPKQASRRTAFQKPTLSFVHSGGSYALTQVWLANSLEGLQLPQHSRPTRFTSRATGGEQPVVLIQAN